MTFATTSGRLRGLDELEPARHRRHHRHRPRRRHGHRRLHAPQVLQLGRIPASGRTAARRRRAPSPRRTPRLSATWDVDPKKACNRAYGVILCTDGQSNTCNTGTPAGCDPANPTVSGTRPTTPCIPDTNGIDFANFPPGAAEAMYLNAHQAGPGDAIVRARTFAIGISSDISRCELNRIAYRGRTDANAKNEGRRIRPLRSHRPAGPARRRPPAAHQPGPETAGTTVPTDESGPGTPASPAAQPVRPGPGAAGQQGLRLLRERRPRRSMTPSSRSCGARRAATTRRALPFRERPSASETRSS